MQRKRRREKEEKVFHPLVLDGTVSYLGDENLACYLVLFDTWVPAVTDTTSDCHSK